MSTFEIEFTPEALAATAMFHLRGRASYKEAAQLRKELFAATHVHGRHHPAGAARRVELSLAELVARGCWQ